MNKHYALLFAGLLLIQLAFAQTVTRGPYLQSLTPTSIKVKWRTSSATDSRVYYGTDPNNLDQYTDVAASVTNHTVKLSNLLPYTTYYYSAGSTTQVQSGPSPLHHFTTAPVAGTEQPYRFWAIGDFGKNNQGQRDVMNSYLNQLGSNHIDMWLWLGDCVYDNGTDAEYQTKVFDVYSDIMKYIPFYATPGNHDYLSVCAIPCFSDPAGHSGPYFDIVDVPKNAEAGGVASGYELYYSFDYGNAHFISLNSELGSLIGSFDWNGVYGTGNFNNSPVHQWLVNDLSSNTLPWVIVYFHQPPYSKGSHDSDNPIELYMTAMRNNYGPIFEQYGVDIVLCGHSHVYERSYLLKGYHGSQYPTSSSFNMNTHAINSGSGKLSQGEPYVKYTDGPNVNAGTVYVVNGNSGSRDQGAALNHPCMYYGDDGYGSFMMEVNGSRLDGKYLSSTGTVMDEFTILKTPVTITKTVNVSICTGQSYFVGGAHQTTSGAYYDNIAGLYGTDTVITTNLSVNSSITGSHSISICDGESYLAGGAHQTTSGAYVDFLTASAGCDSIHTTNLTVNPLSASPTVSQQNNVLSVPVGFASYQWYKDNVPLSGETLPDLQVTTNGNYHVEVIDANGCSAASNAVSVISTGMKLPETINMKLQPNPVTNDLLVIFSKVISGDFRIEVFNTLGERVILESLYSFNGDKVEIGMSNLPTGIYTVKASGKQVDFTGRVVKE